MRRTSLTATILLAVLGAAGCVGSLEPMTGDDDDDDTPADVDAGTVPASAGRQLYDRDLAAMVEQECAACHAGAVGTQPYKFLGAVGNSADNYDALVSDQAVIGGWNPALATILTRGAHDGRAWTDAEKAKFSAWMAQEAMDRNVDLSNPPPAPTNGPLSARQALAQWSACMQLTDWTAANVVQWANKGTNNNGPCRQCHNNGAGALFANNNAEQMFEMNRQEIFIKSLFTVAPKNLADPTQGYEVVVNEQKLCQKGAGDGQAHPNYNCQGGAMDALKNFYNTTKGKLASCTATPAFPTTPPAQ
jgi:hypothetical protein